MGRFVCGFLCPFGLIQDLLHKIPFPKKPRTFRSDRLLRKLKYAILILFVILLPMFLTDILGPGFSPGSASSSAPQARWRAAFL